MTPCRTSPHFLEYARSAESLGNIKKGRIQELRYPTYAHHTETPTKRATPCEKKKRWGRFCFLPPKNSINPGGGRTTQIIAYDFANLSGTSAPPPPSPRCLFAAYYRAKSAPNPNEHTHQIHIRRRRRIENEAPTTLTAGYMFCACYLMGNTTTILYPTIARRRIHRTADSYSHPGGEGSNHATGGPRTRLSIETKDRFGTKRKDGKNGQEGSLLPQTGTAANRKEDRILVVRFLQAVPAFAVRQHPSPRFFWHQRLCRRSADDAVRCVS